MESVAYWRPCTYYKVKTDPERGVAQKLKIGELARRANCQAETIRYYEREGLWAAPVRSAGGYRLYDATHLERLAFIRHCRSLDMTLDEIRVLLHFIEAPTQNCGEVNALLDEHIGHVGQRIRALRELERELKGLREQCRGVQKASECGILGGLTRAARRNSKARPTTAGHVHGAHAGLGTHRRKTSR